MKKIKVDGKIYMVRQYGAENTNIELTENAQKMYDGTDPMCIYENIDITEKRRYVYEIAGEMSRWMTLEELNEDLELLQASIEGEENTAED